MTDVYLDSPPLTAEQRAVVEQPWDARVLVTAGAGAGKTHTLVRRLDALCGHEDPEESLDAADILVLTFSRAAARELRERITRHGDRARRVRAQTFDAWAYGVLAQAYPDRDWATTSFDERIRVATEAVEEGALESGDSVPPSHVVIDEVQDLLGDRRELVEALLDRYQDSCGFTVVGDAAQSVYGFQIEDPAERNDETGRFFEWLRRSYPDDLVELHLTENFRAVTPEARVALSHGPRLQRVRDADEAATLYEELRDLLVDPVNTLADLTDEYTLQGLRDLDDTCAVLTRDNRQALVVSRLLHENGIEHRLRRPLEERPVPPGWPSCCAVPRPRGCPRTGSVRCWSRSRRPTGRTRAPCGRCCDARRDRPGGPPSIWTGCVAWSPTVVSPTRRPTRRPRGSSSPPCTGPRAWSSTG